MRRLTSTMALLTALVLAMATMAASVTAQDDTATEEHPLVGSWIIDPTPEDPGDADELVIVAPGGVLIDASLGGVGAGSWSATGERSADATFVAPALDPQGGFMGFLTIRTSVEVSEDGQSFSGTYTLEFPAGMGEAFGLPAGELGPGNVEAQRVSVEAMGEPAGPIPDFEQLFPPDEGTAPAPEASPTVEEMPPVEASPAPEGSPAA